MQRGGHLLRQGLKCDLYVNTKKGDPSDKLPISKTDRELIQKWKGGSGITAEIALSVSRQGWISSRQRAILHKDGQRSRSSGWCHSLNRILLK